jgi:peroxidase
LLTSFLDASNIYGVSAEASLSLRALKQGQLKTSPGFGGSTTRPYLPLDGRENSFLSGEGRANENMALASIHVLFVREHNRLAAQLSSLNPQWNDERLFLGKLKKFYKFPNWPFF